MPATIRFGVLIALQLVAAGARAQSEPAAKSGNGQTGNGQAELALMDGVSLGAATTGYFVGRAGLGQASGILWVVGGVGYFIGGPVVHLSNEEYGLAGASAVMRLVFPLVGAAIGGSMTTCPAQEGLCGLEEAAQGFAVGAATAVIADNLVTALVKASEVQPQRIARGARPSNPVRVLPSLIAAPNVAMFGVGGRF